MVLLSRSAHVHRIRQLAAAWTPKREHFAPQPHRKASSPRPSKQDRVEASEARAFVSTYALFVHSALVLNSLLQTSRRWSCSDQTATQPGCCECTRIEEAAASEAEDRRGARQGARCVHEGRDHCGVGCRRCSYGSWRRRDVLKASTDLHHRTFLLASVMILYMFPKFHAAHRC